MLAQFCAMLLFLWTPVSARILALVLQLYERNKLKPKDFNIRYSVCFATSLSLLHIQPVSTQQRFPRVSILQKKNNLMQLLIGERCHVRSRNCRVNCIVYIAAVSSRHTARRDMLYVGVGPTGRCALLVSCLLLLLLSNCRPSRRPRALVSASLIYLDDIPRYPWCQCDLVQNTVIVFIGAHFLGQRTNSLSVLPSSALPFL